VRLQTSTNIRYEIRARLVIFTIEADAREKETFANSLTKVEEARSDYEVNTHPSPSLPDLCPGKHLNYSSIHCLTDTTTYEVAVLTKHVLFRKDIHFSFQRPGPFQVVHGSAASSYRRSHLARIFER